MHARRILLALGLSIALMLVALWAWTAAQRPGRTVYVGGPILTMDAADRVVSGLAVDGERIALVGDEDAVRAWAADNGARVVDLAGRAVLPGFIDAHGHFPGEGITAVFSDLNSPPIGEVETIDDVVERLSNQAEKTSAGDWVLGVGYDDTLLEENRHPTRHDLDRASTDHPVAALHVSGHLAAVNSVALAEMEITLDTPDPEGGSIRRDSAGVPDGILEETAMDPIQERLVPSPTQSLAIVRQAGERYVAQGVTTAQSGATNATLISGLDWLAWLGLIPVRMVIWPDAAAADAILEGSLSPPQWDPLRVRVGAVKLIADGSIQGYTGYLREPYTVPPGDDAGYRGYPRIPRDALIESVARYHRAGMQIAVHGNGDASIDDILDAYELAQNAHPRQDARHIIIHSQMARDDQLDRMASLEIIPSFFSLHTFYWGDRHRRVFIGPERAARMSPARSAQDRGIHFTIHCDSPVVPMEPLRLVWSAVNRKTRSGFIVGPEQRIAVSQALRAVTLDAARQHFEDEIKGSLEPGKLADLVILSRSPLDDPTTIDQIEIEETVIGGRSVYRRSDAS